MLAVVIVMFATARSDPAARPTRVATNDFLLRGGDGYGMLGNGETLIDAAAGTLMASEVIDYIAAQDGIGTDVIGDRIVVRQ